MSHQLRRSIGARIWRRAGGTASQHTPGDAAAPVHADSDDDVIELVDRGDLSRAIDCLMRRHGDAVYRYCREALRDVVLADDIHQQVFIEAYRDLGRFARRSTLRVWLFAIARHRVLDAAKKRRRRRDSHDELDAPEPIDPRPSPIDQIDDEQLCWALVACVGELDERIRTPLLLRYQQGFTFEEIARICKEKPGTIRARVVRALPMLQARIEARLAMGPTRKTTPRPRALSSIGCTSEASLLSS